MDIVFSVKQQLSFFCIKQLTFMSEWLLCCWKFCRCLIFFSGGFSCGITLLQLQLIWTDIFSKRRYNFTIYIFKLVGLQAELASCLYVMLSLRIDCGVVLCNFNCFIFLSTPDLFKFLTVLPTLHHRTVMCFIIWYFIFELSIV